MKLSAATILLLAGSLANADTLTLRNGRVVDGTFQGGDSRVIRMVVGNRVETFYLNEVDSLRFGGMTNSAANRDYPRDTPPPPPPPDYSRNSPPPRDDRAPMRPDRDYDRRNDVGGDMGVTIPGGSSLSVRMTDSVDSERDRVGQTFRASLDEPIYVNGQTVVPRGADVVVKLVDQSQSGKFEGRTSLTLDLVSIRVNGRDVNINTSEVRQESNSRGSRTGKVVGGTAALGAIIGAIAGGGKGAAIGAASGAGVGAGAQAITSGQRVKIPSETRLTFTLQQPLQI